MARVKNVLQKCEDVIGKIDARYDVGADEIDEIYKGSSNFYELITNGFRLGYIQGMKAAMSKMKKGGVSNG